MFTANIFLIDPNWKQPRHPSTDEQTNQFWHINSMEYYSAIKRDAPLKHSTWMHLKSTMLNERSQTQKKTYYIISLKLQTKEI